jgi:hypothetical protein
MFTLTQALRSAFIDPQLTDPSNNKPGPSFEDLDRMEDFWDVRKIKNKSFSNIILFNSI